MKPLTLENTEKLNPHFDWREVARWLLLSRAMDAVEETELYPRKKINYQFSARGHELSQILLGSLLNHPHDAAGAYYRSRPFLLTQGLTIEDSFAAHMAKSGSFSGGRDIGAVCNLPSHGKATVLPMAGEVGSQFTPCAGWAQAVVYRRKVLQEKAYDNAIAVALGGEGSVATTGFWSALTIATTLRLPVLFYIEDNGFSLSVPGDKQTPGGNIADNLASFNNLLVMNGDGTDPVEGSAVLKKVVDHVRCGKGPALIRLTVPRLCGHSGQDKQAYKSREVIEEEKTRDPLDRLFHHLVPALLTESGWRDLEQEAQEQVQSALAAVWTRPAP